MTGRKLAPLFIVFLLSPSVAASEPARERQRDLLYLLKQDCGSCHGLTMKGGLGPPLLPTDIAGQDDDVLINTILKGRPGTPMGPWDFAISRTEAAWLVHRLREGVGDAP